MFLTIFTSTYNRASLLTRLYDSLCSQSNKDFEWLIVDDGSTDNTKSVVDSLISENKICIRYYQKENGGKHTAHNFAIEKAYGDWFFCVDSDDWLTDNAVQKILDCLSKVEPTDFAILGYKSLSTGGLLSNEFDSDFLSGTHKSFYEWQTLGFNGEFSIIMKVDDIKDKPFPVINGERFCTESVLYDKFNLNKKTICLLPEVLTICEYQNDGLTSNIYSSLANNPTSYQIYHLQRLDLVNTLKERIKHAIQYQAFKKMSNNNDYIYHGKHSFLTKLAYIPGLLGAIYYKIRCR